MTVTISQVRTAINIPDESDLADDVFELSLSRAQTKVDAMAKPTASDALKDDAVLFLAAFYSYLTYSDRISHNPEGTYNSETGQWEPVLDVEIRNAPAKLDALRREAHAALDMIRHHVASLV